MGDYLNTAAEIEMQNESYKMWEQREGKTNREALNRARKMMPVALQESLSDTQRAYILAYFAEELTMAEIGARFGVNKATVSRTINRGLNRLSGCLRFTDPWFLELENVRNMLRIDPKKGCKQRRLRKRRAQNEKREL